MQQTLSSHDHARMSHSYWLTWIIPFVICYAGTLISLNFKFTDNTTLLYLPLPLAMVMIQWWGPRILAGLYLSAVVTSGLWGLQPPALWPLYAMPEMLAVLISWILFTKVLKGRPALTKISDLIRFMIFAIVPSACIYGFCTSGLHLYLVHIESEPLRDVVMRGFSSTILGEFAITVPLLMLFSHTLEKNGWSRVIHSISGLHYFEKSQSFIEYAEKLILFLVPLGTSLFMPISEYWYLYMVFGIWSAMRYGIGLTIVLNSWIVLLTLVIPSLRHLDFLSVSSEAFNIIDFHFGLSFVCGASTLIGSAITTLRREIRAHRQTLEDLIKEKDFTDTVLQTMADTFVLFDPVTLEPIRWNRAFREITGYNDSELNNPSVLLTLLSQDEHKRISEIIPQLIKHRSNTIEVCFLHKDNKLIPVEFHLTLIVDKSDKPEYLIAIGRDISDRKLSEAKLRESEIQYRTTFQFSRDAINVFNTKYQIIDVNNRLIEISGYSLDELLKMSIKGIYLTAGGEESKKRIQSLLKGETVPLFETELRTKAGKIIPVEIGVSSMRNCYGEECVFMGVVRDITDRKKTEEMIRNSQRLESLGILAGGIAHDFNNLMGGVFGNVELAKESIDNRSSALMYIDRTLKALERAKDLTQQLLTFSKGGVPRKSLISLYLLIDESSTFALSGSNIRCITQISRNLHTVNADPNQISQVLNNLLINARQAMDKGGTITITAKNTEIVENEVRELTEGEYVSIEIHDEGHGIPQSMLHKVFDPFFTTKKTGTGLGLATCHSIIRKHDGAISVESVHGKGTTFRVLLPASNELVANSVNNEVVNNISMSGRVLVLDDEESLRNVARGFLEIFGFDVITVSDGYEALEIFKREHSRGKPFSIVILDLTVPGGFGGEQVMKEIRLFDPHVIGIVASGFSDSEILSQPEKFGFNAKIEKPFRKNDLSSILEDALLKKCAG